MRFLAVILAVATLPLAAQKAPPVSKPDPVACRYCKSLGGQLCKGHSKKAHKLEKNVLVCSRAADCEQCTGGLIHDCKYCKNVGVENSAKARRALARSWLVKRRKEVDARLSKPEILHAKTKYVNLTFSIPPLTVGRQKLSTHELMHLYVDRLMALRTDFMKVLELTDKDFTTPIDVYMFKKNSSHMEISPRVTGFGASRGSGQKLMGVHMVYSMWFLRSRFRNDKALHASVVHNVTHLLLNHMAPPIWIYNKRHGWIDAGLAHWFEYRLIGRATNYCFEEVAIGPVNVKGGKYRLFVRKLFEKKDELSLARFYNRNTDQLGVHEHALSFAYVDHLITVHGGRKFRDLIRAVKNKATTPDALKKVYGKTFFQIDKELRKWVLKTYPAR